MKIIKPLFCAMSFAVLSLSASAQTGTVEVDFGGLRASPVGNPTVVLSGTGTLGTALTGNSLYWVCLDIQQDDPANQVENYTVSTDPSVLQAGRFGSSGYSADVRGAIVQATTNMFYAFQDELLTTSGNQYASAFQRAVWGVTFAYISWGETGPLTTDVINTVLTNYDSFIQDEPLIGDMLNQALTTPTGPATVYFGNPTTDSTLQPVMFFPASSVPEPSTVTLSGLLGLFCLTHRRRK